MGEVIDYKKARRQWHDNRNLFDFQGSQLTREDFEEMREQVANWYIPEPLQLPEGLQEDLRLCAEAERRDRFTLLKGGKS